jgi:hypothetical protein
MISGLATGYIAGSLLRVVFGAFALVLRVVFVAFYRWPLPTAAVVAIALLSRHAIRF